MCIHNLYIFTPCGHHLFLPNALAPCPRTTKLKLTCNSRSAHPYTTRLICRPCLRCTLRERARFAEEQRRLEVLDRMQRVAWGERCERLRALGVACDDESEEDWDEYEGPAGQENDKWHEMNEVSGVKRREDDESEDAWRRRRRKIRTHEEWGRGIIQQPRYEQWKWKVKMGVDSEGRRGRGGFGEEGAGDFQILDLARWDERSPSAIGRGGRGEKSPSRADGEKLPGEPRKAGWPWQTTTKRRLKPYG